MKKSELKHTFFKRKNVLLSLLAFMVTTMIITYSCSKNNVANNNEPQTVPEARAFEKQFIVFDNSGNNSITLRVSSDDATLLTDCRAESYELIINPEIPKETKKDEITTAIEASVLIDFNNSIEVKRVTVQMDIINVSFKDKVNNYALVSHGTFKIDEDEAEMEEGELKGGLCRWFPRPSEGFEYYNANVWGATKVKVTFKRTKKTCNNIKYYVCEYNTTSILSYKFR